MTLNVKAIWGLLKETVSAWSNDKAPRLGAALAYYTVFAIPPLLIIVLFVASLVFDPNEVRTQLFSQVGGLIGKKSADAIQSAMAAQSQSNQGTIASMLAIVTLAITATGLFIELQSALNSIWGVEAKAGQGIFGFIKTRLLSFAMIVGIGFLLLVSLVVSAGLSAFSNYVSALVPGINIVWQVANIAVSFAVITVLFAMIFKVLPDIKTGWRGVWLGAAVTSLLFTAGKSLLGMYLGKSSAVSAYGAAGSLVLLLLWVYYSAQILFFGAELTKAYAIRYGKCPVPKENAQWATPPKPIVCSLPGFAGARESAPVQTPRPKELLEELREEVGALRGLVKQ